MPKLFHTRTNISETVKNVTVETNYLVEAIQALLLIVLEVFMLISITAFLLIINFKITCYVFLIMIVFSILIYLFNSKILQKLGRERMRFTEQRLKAIFEGLSSSKLLENKSIKEKSINNFDTHNFNLANIARIQYFRNTIPKPLFELLVMVFIVLSFSLFLLSKQNLTTILPLLGTFLAAGYRLTPSFGRIITALQTYKFTILAGSKLLSDKRRFELNKAHVDKKQIGNLQNKSLDISNLTFSYEKNSKDEKKIVFKNLNIKINIGKKIGIVGESGSGKSTLLDLIMGLLPFEKGKILINGNSVDDIKSQWQSKISCVPQNIFISDQSLKNNIAFGENEKEIDLKKIDKALKISNLNEFKDDLKFGLDTLLGENGARISGGQRQRIGIARAIYNNSEILILDESTNALDSKNEKKIIEEIFNNALNKTIIIVSHNKENFKFCDEIYEIKNKELNKLTSIYMEAYLVFDLRLAYELIKDKNFYDSKKIIFITDKIVIYNLLKSSNFKKAICLDSEISDLERKKFFLREYSFFDRKLEKFGKKNHIVFKKQK